ncbi:hypothetical protein PV646_23240 [Streptomyces sp. ID05-26A]|nr:hypothetical protein [Streptomyces sp. ID05-26A]
MGTYRGTAELAWLWVLDQVREDDTGVWIPEFLGGDLPGDWRDGMYAGVGGLAHVLAEIRLSREWTTREAALAEAVVARVRGNGPAEAGFFDGWSVRSACSRRWARRGPERRSLGCWNCPHRTAG